MVARSNDFLLDYQGFAKPKIVKTSPWFDFQLFGPTL
jgi:hypothetical protein